MCLMKWHSLGVKEEINRDVSNISHVSKEISTGAEHNAKACRELLELANQLPLTVGHFRI
jgi:methyl-accepting chemotaxis protein